MWGLVVIGFIGFIGLIGSIGFIGLIGFIGFIEFRVRVYGLRLYSRAPFKGLGSLGRLFSEDSQTTGRI